MRIGGRRMVGLMRVVLAAGVIAGTTQLGLGFAGAAPASHARAGTAPATIVVDRQLRTFIPQQVVVADGTTISFCNKDPYYESEFSVHKYNDFTLRTAPGHCSEQTFVDPTDQPLSFGILDEIHSEAKMFITVLPDGYGGQTPALDIWQLTGSWIGYPYVATSPAWRLQASDGGKTLTATWTGGAGHSGLHGGFASDSSSFQDGYYVYSGTLHVTEGSLDVTGTMTFKVLNYWLVSMSYQQSNGPAGSDILFYRSGLLGEPKAS